MTKDMTQGSPLKLILAFAVPLMLGSLFQHRDLHSFPTRRSSDLHPHLLDLRCQGL